MEVLRILGDVESSPAAKQEYRCISTRDVVFPDGRKERWINRTLVKGKTRRHDLFGAMREATMVEDGRYKVWEDRKGWVELQRTWDNAIKSVPEFPPTGSPDDNSEPVVMWGNRPQDLYVTFGRTNEGTLVWDVDWGQKLVRGRSYWDPEGRLAWDDVVTEERKSGGRFPVSVVHRSHNGDADHVEKWEWKIGPGSVWLSELYEDPSAR